MQWSRSLFATLYLQGNPLEQTCLHCDFVERSTDHLLIIYRSIFETLMWRKHIPIIYRSSTGHPPIIHLKSIENLWIYGSIRHDFGSIRHDFDDIFMYHLIFFLMVPMSNYWVLAQIFGQIFDRLPTDFQQISTIGPIGYFFLPDPPHGKRRGDR